MLVSCKNFLKTDRKFFLLLFVITFTVFVFTSDGHRYTIDEFYAHEQTFRIVTQEPDPLYVQDQSRMLFQLPEMFPWESGPFCQNAILCYPVYIGHSITQVPFVFLNHNFNLITKDTVVLTADDFDEPHYIFWRNSQEPDFTFLELFYGPLFSSLIVAVFYLICRTFDFNQKTSITLALFLGFTTPVWAYSQTSLNGIPETFFILLGFFYFRKFQKTNHRLYYLIFSGSSIGFAFLVRPDAILFIIPLVLFLLYLLRQQSEKIKKSLAFIVPISLSYVIYLTVNFIRLGVSPLSSVTSNVSTLVSDEGYPAPLHEGVFGLLLSPGIGLLIFAPILFTIFFSFPDFFSKHKKECLLFLSFIAIFLISFGKEDPWHGLIAWAARYIFPVIPFLLLPLGVSIQKRKNRFFIFSLIILAGLGVFFNIIYLIQDVSWFVWTFPGSHTGLFGLSTPEIPLYIHPVTIWTFEYSQLTWSIKEAFVHLQPDIYLLHLMGSVVFTLSFLIVIAILGYLLVRCLKKCQSLH